MAINKKLIHFKNFSDFNSKKLSANENNTQYTLGINGTVTNGSPEVLYQSICYIKDTKQQWTHGQLYDGTNLNEAGFLAGEETSDQLDDVETLTYVKYVPQTLTEEQKAQARANIGVGTGSPGGSTGGSDITEQVILSWGFTKNTGTYSKPSGGIPKSDLASSVQTSLGKADTALQSYTEQYKGTITGIKMNGSSKGTSGVVDLGTVLTEHQNLDGKQDKLVSGTNIKTINGTSILGSGDISIGEGTGGGKELILNASLYYDDASPVQPNKIYIKSTSSFSFYIGAFQEVSDYDEYCIIFKYPEEPFYLPESVKFANGQIPTIEYDTECELSVVGIGSGANRTYHAVLTPFKAL